eukprot:scaffold34_cov260-Pinguiococcus_pyrenoidosus.AAC.6
MERVCRSKASQISADGLELMRAGQGDELEKPLIDISAYIKIICHANGLCDLPLQPLCAHALQAEDQQRALRLLLVQTQQHSPPPPTRQHVPKPSRHLSRVAYLIRLVHVELLDNQLFEMAQHEGLPRRALLRVTGLELGHHVVARASQNYLRWHAVIVVCEHLHPIVRVAAEVQKCLLCSLAHYPTRPSRPSTSWSPRTALVSVRLPRRAEEKIATPDGDRSQKSAAAEGQTAKAAKQRCALVLILQVWPAFAGSAPNLRRGRRLQTPIHHEPLPEALCCLAHLEGTGGAAADALFLRMRAEGAVQNVAVVLLAGGVGSRMKADRPKQFLTLAGKPVMQSVRERGHRSQVSQPRKGVSALFSYNEMTGEVFLGARAYAGALSRHRRGPTDRAGARQAVPRRMGAVRSCRSSPGVCRSGRRAPGFSGKWHSEVHRVVHVRRCP